MNDNHVEDQRMRVSSPWIRVSRFGGFSQHWASFVIRLLSWHYFYQVNNADDIYLIRIIAWDESFILEIYLAMCESNLFTKLL